MKKTTYKAIGFIPFAGKIIQMKSNFFELLCSPMREHLMEIGAWDELMKWCEKHPNQILSRETANKIVFEVENNNKQE